MLWENPLKGLFREVRGRLLTTAAATAALGEYDRGGVCEFWQQRREGEEAVLREYVLCVFK